MSLNCLEKSFHWYLPRESAIFVDSSLVCLFLHRGERTVSHVQDKNISKGQRHPLRPWDGKERPFESKIWHHGPPQSFNNRAGTNNGYAPAPGDCYVSWDNSVSNSVVRLEDCF